MWLWFGAGKRSGVYRRVQFWELFLIFKIEKQDQSLIENSRLQFAWQDLLMKSFQSIQSFLLFSVQLPLKSNSNGELVKITHGGIFWIHFFFHLFCNRSHVLPVCLSGLLLIILGYSLSVAGVFIHPGPDQGIKILRLILNFTHICRGHLVYCMRR